MTEPAKDLDGVLHSGHNYILIDLPYRDKPVHSRDSSVLVH